MAQAAAADSSVEAVLAQIAAAQASDPGALASDQLTQQILARLNEEVARVYAEASAAGEDLDEEEEHEEEGDENEDDGAGSPGRSDAGAGSRVQLRKGPLPVDLWKAAHEVDRTPKERVVLTQQAWGDLVSRLNESSRRKQLSLLKAQHKQIADQLAGLTFAPQISQKSRELAAMNRSLPDRVAALMRKKKAKLDKIRMEKAQKELSEATFKPQLNKRKEENPERRIGHLLQYEIDRRVRAEQRKALIEEMENKSLTFAPSINKNSARIVERLQREAAERAAMAALGEGSGAGAGSPGREGGVGGSGTSVTASQTQSRAAAERKRVEDILLGKVKGLGRTHLPGHEQETFHPTINPRSKALHRAGVDDKVVHERLYQQRKRAEAEQEEKVRAMHRREEEDAALPPSTTRVPSSYPVGPTGEAAPGHPQYFNAVAWSAAGGHDFLLRRLLATPPSYSSE